ncbi:hypothetical protein BKA65DRAFT_489278 [Rhexocercosporidium sp. MPI-PUGE-AT-0058]|nr:hypothetical protein BKA65DRAFT_489278 [Rhexocercosporidium sp. MPI-PUGE-AT-0058]
MTTQPAADNTALYDELMKYDWDGDEVFQGGLRAIRGPNPPSSEISSLPDDLTLHAQIFYFSRKKSTTIDFNSYREYLYSKRASTASPSSKETPTNPASSTSESESPSIPTSITQATSTQPHHQPDPSTNPAMAVASTPTDPTTFSASTPGAQGGAQPGAPYPRSFAEIVALIQSGAPIPGIKEFDDTPLGLAASSPSVLPKRRKPWEKDVPEEIIQGRGPGTFGDHRDHIIEQEYPDA